MTAPAIERPLWMAQPCASWCVANHHDADAPGSRVCESPHQAITLTLEPSLLGPAGWFLEELHLTIEQQHREAEPHIAVFKGDGSGFTLTIAEFEQLVEHGRRLIQEARS